LKLLLPSASIRLVKPRKCMHVNASML
jgi:hypothetical protein